MTKRLVIVEDGVVTNSLFADAWPGAIEHSEACIGWLLVAGQLVPPSLPEPKDLDEAKHRLRERATALRWEQETGGITVGGVRVLTGVEDQNRIATALIGAPATLDFKADSGWVTLTLAELQGIAAAITAHVQACFSAERAHHEAIDGLPSLEDAAAYDVDAGWP